MGLFSSSKKRTTNNTYNTSTTTDFTTPQTLQPETGNAYATAISGIENSTIRITDGGAVQQAIDLSRAGITNMQETNRIVAAFADGFLSKALGLFDTAGKYQAKTQTEAISAVRAAAGDRDQRIASERSQIVGQVVKGVAVVATISGLAYAFGRK